MKTNGICARGLVFVIAGGLLFFTVVKLASRSEPASNMRGRPPDSDMNEKSKRDIVCIGRFELTVPLGLDVTERSQSIYDVEVSTIALPAGGIRALWEDRLSRIRALTPTSAATLSIVRTFELQPGVRAVWYIKDPRDDRFRDFEAVKGAGDHAVLASTDAASGKEPIVERLVANVLNAYVPAATDGFCVGAGSVTSKPSVSEHAHIAFENRNLANLKVSFETQTLGEPDTRTYSDIDEEKQVVGPHGQISVLRDQLRSAGGLEGKEMWISVTVPGERPFLRFTWHFPGVSKSSSQPSINIVGTAPTDQRAELQSTWEFLLQSLRAMPLSPQP